jgi:2-C-methyl-D-erythritol 2,4-cyclodiphosphate synthase
MKVRVGQGFDAHALVRGRRLMLGGVEIPHEHGLLGHSDADVLLHAITDAILGAAGMGDIGKLFPDTDGRYEDAASRDLLTQAAESVRAAGWRIENIDATVIAEQPKIAPHVPAMVAVVAAACAIPGDAINIKGKTSEKLGFTGRGEGIAAHAVALLVSNKP